MASVRLTRRGKIVLTLAILLTVWFAFEVTTPAECKVPFEELPQWCVEFLYP